VISCAHCSRTGQKDPPKTIDRSQSGIPLDVVYGPEAIPQFDPETSESPWPPWPACSDNVLFPLKQALAAGATIGEICDELRLEWGTYESTSLL
jgi:hypothetical protein